jgi:glycosyltransferase involved in cell wall biosynthesis
LGATGANKKLIRITTVPMALRYLLPGQMRFMAANGFDVIMISADGKELKDVIENEECPHIIVPMTRKITPFRDLKCLFSLIRIFKKEKPDIVHTHTPKAGLLGMLAAKYCGVRVRIHTVAGLPMMVEKGLKYQLLKLTEKITNRAASQVWPNSYSLLQFISSHHLAKEEKLKVIAKGSTNGINLQRFDPAVLDEKKITEIRASLHYDRQFSYLLCIGRLVKDKGIVELINVFLKLQKNSASIKLILVGDYEAALDPLPADTINEIRSNKDIVHIGWTEDVEYYMHIADLFVFPSRREGFPNVLLQAGAMELPIICSGIPGNVDIVTHKETGMIFEDGNEPQMLEMIRYALDEPAMMRAMAEKLKVIVGNDFRRENIWQNMLAAYKSSVN